MKTKILIAAMMAAMFISSTTFAQHTERQNRKPDRKAMMMRHEMRENFRKNSFLTDEQKEEVKKIRLETAKEVKPFKDQLGELEAHQQTLATAENADMKAIYKNIDKIAEVKAELAKTMAKQRQEIRSLLTDEQRLKLDQRRERMKHTEKPFMRNRLENRNSQRFGLGNGA